VAELVDALASGASDRKIVEVRNASRHFARPEARIDVVNRAEAGSRNFSEKNICDQVRFEPL